MGNKNSNQRKIHKSPSSSSTDATESPLSSPLKTLSTMNFEVPCRTISIPKKFFEPSFQTKQYDIHETCNYFKKVGLRPAHGLPFHEVCIGIAEINSFVECFTKNAHHLKYLKKVSLQWNILSYMDLENDHSRIRGRVLKLGNELRKMKNLEHLEFKISRNQPKSLLALFDSVVNSKHLKKITFELQASKCQREDILRITNLLKKANNLEELNLSFKRCIMSDEALELLFNCITRLLRIKTVRLNFAFMSTMKETSIQSITELPEKLPQLNSLFVNLSGTEFEDRHIRRFMESFQKSKSMQQCCVKVGSCRRVSHLMVSEANKLPGFKVSK